jgi:hypothetical protein
MRLPRQLTLLPVIRDSPDQFPGEQRVFLKGENQRNIFHAPIL